MFFYGVSTDNKEQPVHSILDYVHISKLYKDDCFPFFFSRSLLLFSALDIHFSSMNVSYARNGHGKPNSKIKPGHNPVP